jgi:glucose/arabinose dehydrogenase
MTSVLVLLTLAAVLASAGARGDDRPDLGRYAVPQGFSLEVDSRGFHLPTSIAVIPDPGDEADAPLYFVAELQGTIKVVTRSREVHDFATVPTWGRQDESLTGTSQQGLAGLCLAPAEGHLFATFTEPDEGGVLRNRIVRFDSEPERYALQPNAATVVGEILADYQSSPAHQIGNCVAWDGRLVIGVGDGGDPAATARPSVLLGKIICMTFDGEPCGASPYGDEGPEAFVWATGFRNPFGLAVVDDVLHAAENGIGVDRFLRVARGEDHMWRGTDQSLAARADLLFIPAMSPVQLAYVPAGDPSMPQDWPGHFVTANFGGADVPPGVAMFGSAGAEAGRPIVPTFLVEYLGPERSQHFGGVALHDDGLLVVPMLPVDDGEGVVLRLRYAPGDAHPVNTAVAYSLHRNPSMEAINRFACTGCHSVAGVGGGIGPALDRFAFNWRLTERLNTDGYEEQLAAVDALDREPFVSYAAAREEVRSVSGRERTYVWLKHFLQEPRFDDPESQMPNLGLSESDAEAVREELYQVLSLGRSGTQPGLVDRGIRFARTNWRALMLGAVGGGGAVLVLGAAILVVARRRPRRDGR